MQKFFSRIEKSKLNMIKQVGRIADREGLRVFLVGGVVRDILLGKEVTDLDFVVEGQAIPLAQKVASKLRLRATVYRQFKTASVTFKDGRRIDFASTRGERYSHPGALPKAYDGSLLDDLQRRDFSVNAMAIPINAKRNGAFIDPCNGLYDLKRKLIRVLHKRSFIDDPTRIYRAIRFEQRFKFNIERRTLALLKKVKLGKNLNRVSASRYLVELRKILREQDPVPILARLTKLQALNILHPLYRIDLKRLRKIQHNMKRLTRLLGRQPDPSYSIQPRMYLLAMMEGLTPQMLKAIIKKFPLTRHEISNIKRCQEVLSIIRKLNRKQSSSEIYKTLKPLSEDLVMYLYIRTENQKVRGKIKRYLNVDCRMRIDINGRDLKQMYCPQGNRIGHILNETLYQKIDQRLRTRREQLQFAKNMILNP